MRLGRPSILSLALTLLAALVAGCPDEGVRTSGGDGPTKTYDPKGKTIVVVLDVSGSMTANDPERLSIEGTHLIAGLVEEGDNVGAVRFSSDARVLAPIRPIYTPDDRRKLCQEITPVRREGSTNYVAALDRCREMLEAVNAPAGASVIFMTDGEHNTGGDKNDVLARVQEFRKRGWKIYALGYSPEGRSELLSQLATRTGGGFFLATTPKELLLAYVKISEELQGFLISDRIRPVRVFQGTGRLLYVVLKGGSATRLATVTREGQPTAMEGPTTYHYPGPGESSKAFEVLRIKSPQAGKWDGKVEGPYEVGLILQDAPFDYAFAEGAPQKEQVDGRPVRLTFLVKGDKVSEIKASSSVSARVTSFDGREVASLDLAPAPAPDATTLAFSAEFTPKLRDPGKPETHTVAGRFLYKEGDVTWTHDQTVAYRLVPPPASSVEVSPTTIDFGTIFAGEVSKEAEATVRASGASAKHIAAQASQGVSVAPGALDDVPKEGAKVRVSCAPAEDAKEFAGTVAFTPEGATDDTQVARLAVKAKVVRLRAPAAIALGDVMAGETGSAPVAVAGDDPRIALPPLAGPGGASLQPRLVDKDGKQTLECEVPATAPPGRYQGTMDVTVGGATKRVPVDMTVTPAAARLSGLPEKIGHAASKNGNTPPQTSEVRLAYVEPCDVSVQVSDLVLAGGKRSVRASDVKVALDGLQGGKATPDTPLKLTSSVRVSPDLQPGTYTGKATVTLKSADGRSSVKEIPIELNLTR